MSFTKYFPWIFGTVSVAEIIAEFFPDTHYYIKPLLMVLLMAYFYIETQGRRDKNVYILLAALFFSWWGDIFLMFGREELFIFGLASFLITHVLYVVVFARSGYPAAGRTLLGRSPWLAFIFFGYLVMMFLLIYPGLGEMLAPVIVYALAIVTMVLLALNRWEKVSQKSFNWVFLGALLFMFSDSMIALNKFWQEIPLHRIWIMATYLGGQFFIVKGYLREVKAEEV